MEPTPKCYKNRFQNCAQSIVSKRTNAESRHHLALLLSVNEIVMILHRDKGRQLVGDRIVLTGKVGSWLEYDRVLTYFALRGLDDRGPLSARYGRSEVLMNLHCQAQQDDMPI